MNKIEDWAKESEEERLEKIVRDLDARGFPRDKICEYLCKVANRYLAEMGYDSKGELNAGLGEGEFIKYER